MTNLNLEQQLKTAIQQYNAVVEQNKELQTALNEALTSITALQNKVNSLSILLEEVL